MHREQGKNRFAAKLMAKASRMGFHPTRTVSRSIPGQILGKFLTTDFVSNGAMGLYQSCSWQGTSGWLAHRNLQSLHN